MTSERSQRMRNQRGYTLVELLTAVAIFGVLAAAGLPHVDNRRMDLETATRQIVADYRWARSRAITGGVHFDVNWTDARNYKIERLKLSGTSWILDKVVKTGTLPSYISRSGTPAIVEFNTRGMMISATNVSWYDINDSKFGGTRKIGVWPSGQANAYD